ncbi:hypothetical protein DAPPUDRAFT_318691 [Daphnia pulex]|uniref:Uncharacterized protein n=1 Tax=Daphnia pulex TaxID=6669 RepID=E9GJK3_DAPPU|nr:hypothetical protein DAPPUDRAFT_318691 [Daphnia pulex]|eukprot:EFX80485.1 hypothetical protein DAPPUDRAFT_318691 [Daphnia pulex]
MSDTIRSKKYFNQPDPITIFSKFGVFAYAALRRALSSFLPSLKSESNNAPPLNVDVVKLGECGEEYYDCKRREAKFALRSTDLGSWNPTTPQGGSNNATDSTTIQHWAVVVHFPEGKGKTFVFQAWGGNGLLQAGWAKEVNKEVFEKAKYFSTVETDPRDLLGIAKQVQQQARYDVILNSSQTWTREFLHLISPKLLTSLYETIPATETYWSYLTRKLNSLSPPQ